MNLGTVYSTMCRVGWNERMYTVKYMYLGTVYREWKDVCCKVYVSRYSIKHYVGWKDVYCRVSYLGTLYRTMCKVRYLGVGWDERMYTVEYMYLGTVYRTMCKVGWNERM